MKASANMLRLEYEYFDMNRLFITFGLTCLFNF